MQYILETSVYPREQEALKELRILTHNHALAIMAAAPDAGQLMEMLLNLVNARKTIEVGVFTGYSLLLTALTLPEDGKVIAINVNRSSYELGLPVIKKAGVVHKIDFRKSEPLPVLDELLNHKENEGGFDFAFVDDADKGSYWNYHERLMRLIKVGGIIVYDKTLWGGSVAEPDSSKPEGKREGKQTAHELNKKLSADKRVQISQIALGIRGPPRRIRVRVARKRNDDEDAKEEFFSLVTVAEIPAEGLSGLGTKVIDEED
ncbi:hypothetical protein Bca101_086976 [Brassica carinata]